MAQSPSKHIESTVSKDNHNLSILLTAISAVPEERDRIRLIVSGIPSLLSCRLSGIGLFEEGNASWNITIQSKGQLLSEHDINPMLSELNNLFKEIITNRSFHQIDNQAQLQIA